MYRGVLKWLEGRGYHLRFDYNAKLQSFHSLYEEHDPSIDPLAPKSVKYPKWFQFLVPASEYRLEAAQDLILDEACLEEIGAGEQEFTVPLFIYRSGRSSEITDHVLGLENLKALRHKKMGGGQYKLGIAFSPDKNKTNKRAIEETYAYVPEKSWFE